MSPSASTRSDALARQADEMRDFMATAVLLQDAIARSGGLGGTDLQVVSILMSQGAATPGQLAERTGLSTGGAITAVIDRLERSGFVRRERDADDRRRVLVHAVVETVMAQVGPIYGRIAERWGAYLASLTDEQLAFANDLLQHATRVNREEIETLRG